MKEEGIIKDRVEAVLKELQTVISVFYIMMVGIGMLFEYQKYNLFGINIFEYADVFDFLIAPFKSPTIFLFILLSLVLTYAIFKLDIFMQKKWSKFYGVLSFGWDKKSWYPTFRYFTMVVIFIVYIFVSSKKLAENSESDFLQNNETVSIVYADNSKISGKIIGKTTETMFFFTNGRVKIIPINSLVKEINLNFNPKK